MSCLQVLAPGLLTTVQDLGRPGYAHLGISASGAADALSLRLGNLLVGNHEGLAALEMTIAGGTFAFPEGATFALAGSDFAAELNGTPVAPWVTTKAASGATLNVNQTLTGARSYLCVRGGIRVPLWLGSASTHLLSGLGGVAGRALQKGDLLRIGRDPFTAAKSTLRRDALDRIAQRATLRVNPGAQSNRFSKATRELFHISQYQVTEEANRMGLRLQGPVLQVLGDASQPSQGVVCGSVQVTGAGQPLILFVEQQTTGGYPLIASVISVDLPSVGQLKPGNAMRFEEVTIAEAVRLHRNQERWIASGDLFT